MQRLVALAFVLTVIVFSAPAFAYTEEQRIACQDDAFRLCGNAIPDEQRVKACMVANLRYLSPACRRQFQRGRR
jgi:hypothetical protein